MIRTVTKLLVGVPQVRMTLPQTYSIVPQYKFASIVDKMQKKQS